MLLIPTLLTPALSMVLSVSQPSHQRSTEQTSDHLVGLSLKETLHYCQVTSVVFSGACSMMIMLAELWSQAEHPL